MTTHLRAAHGRKILSALVLAALVAYSSGPAAAQVKWGKWKNDHCTKPGYRQHSSVLQGIPLGQSWELVCNNTPVNKDRGISGLPSDTNLPRPTRCVTKEQMWGEVDIKDDSCTIAKAAPKMRWGAFKKDHCVAPEKRQYSAVLWNIPGGVGAAGMDWKETCKLAAGIPWDKSANDPRALQDRLEVKANEDSKTSSPDRCKLSRVLGGANNVWGEFDIEDTTCTIDMTKLQWGTWKDEGCVHVPLHLSADGRPAGSKHLHQYAAVLWNIPPGYSWESACQQMPVTIPAGPHTVNRPKADLCVKATGDNVLKWGGMIALTAAGAIPGLGTAASVAVAAGTAAGGIALDLTTEHHDIGGINMWGIVYVDDGSCPVASRRPTPSRR